MARTEPARGMRDFLADDIRRREYVLGIVRRVFESYGYEPLETPAVENLDTLLGKYGDEGNQLIFKILKRGEHEASGQADLALRYDLTVPLARVVAHHQARLPRLYRRYQMQPVWRADRPARGRFREFYQCDIDATGTSSPVVEAEQCAAVSEVLTELGFSDFVIRINHRQVLSGLLDIAEVPADRHSDVLIALDKLDKVGREGVKNDLRDRGFAEHAIGRVLTLFASPAIEHGQEFKIVADTLQGHESSGAVGNLAEILRLTRSTVAGPHLRFSVNLARGLSYYTGAIMEINVPDLAGSLGGGGRYNNLVGMFSKQAVPACGFSLGLERILVVMGERGMFPAHLEAPPADVLVAAFDGRTVAGSMAVAARLRAAGLRVLVYPDPGKLGRQFKYADEHRIPFVAVVGEDEMAAGTVTVKDLAAGTQTTYEQAAAGAALVEAKRQRG